MSELIVGKEISIKSYNTPRNPDLDSIIFKAWKQIAKGKEIARGIRAHILSEAALMIQPQLVINSSDGKSVNCVENQPATFHIEQHELDKIQELYNRVTTKGIMCRNSGTWHDYSTMNITVEEFCQHRKKKKSCP